MHVVGTRLDHAHALCAVRPSNAPAWPLVVKSCGSARSAVWCRAPHADARRLRSEAVDPAGDGAARREEWWYGRMNHAVARLAAFEKLNDALLLRLLKETKRKFPPRPFRAWRPPSPRPRPRRNRRNDRPVRRRTRTCKLANLPDSSGLGGCPPANSLRGGGTPASWVRMHSTFSHARHVFACTPRFRMHATFSHAPRFRMHATFSFTVHHAAANRAEGPPMHHGPPHPCCTHAHIPWALVMGSRALARFCAPGRSWTGLPTRCRGGGLPTRHGPTTLVLHPCAARDVPRHMRACRARTQVAV